MRRSGKTTRMIDESIQYLFEKGKINLSIYHREKSDFLDVDSSYGNKAQMDFVERFERRLQIEHPDCFDKKIEGNLLIFTLKQ